MKTLQEDESVQKMGVVHLKYLLNYRPTSKQLLMEVSTSREQVRVVQCLPIRLAAIYVVSQPRTFDALINSVLKVMGTTLLARTRLLSGKPPKPFHFSP